MDPMRLRLPQCHLSIYKGHPPNSRSAHLVTICPVPVLRHCVYAPHRGLADCLRTARLSRGHPSHRPRLLLWGHLSPQHLQQMSQKPQYLIPNLMQTLIHQFSATVHQRPNSSSPRTKKSNKRRTTLLRWSLPEHHRHLQWTRLRPRRS